MVSKELCDSHTPVGAKVLANVLGFIESHCHNVTVDEVVTYTQVFTQYKKEGLNAGSNPLGRALFSSTG